jgi:hypothetical protein
MDITLSGKIFVYFIRSVFESKQKIGVELIIDTCNSDNQLIDGLQRLNKINKNKIFIKTDDVKIPIRLYDKRYICNVTFEYNNNMDNQSILILKELNVVEYEKTRKIVDIKFKLQNYATSKQKTIDQIMAEITKS